MTKTALSVPQSTNSPMVSLRELSSLKLQAAIRGGSDEGETLKRINAVLGLYWTPDHDPATAAAVREEFVRALHGKPQWAVQRGFDDWVRTMQRRPSPGEIVILVDRQIKPLADELANRAKLAAQSEADRAEAQKRIVSPEAAARIMAEAGITDERIAAVRRFPQARRIEDAQAMDAPKPLTDWTAGLADDDPRLMALRQSRASSLAVRQ